MKSKLNLKTFILLVAFVSALSMIYLEMQDYCMDNGIELTNLIENGEISSVLLPDVFILESIIKNIFNVNI